MSEAIPSIEAIDRLNYFHKKFAVYKIIVYGLFLTQIAAEEL